MVLNVGGRNDIEVYLPLNEGTGTTVYDYSGNSNNGTLTTPNWYKKTDGGYYLDFVSTNSDSLTIGNIGNLRTVAMWVKLDSTTEPIFEGDPNAHLIHASAGTLTYPDWDNAYVNGEDTDTIGTEWSFIVVTSSTNVNCTYIELGLNNTTYGDLFISEVILFNRELSQEEIKDLYKQTYRV